MLVTLGRGMSPARSAPAFSPLDLAALAAWYDAADLATITHVANAVSQWDDKSGNGNHATQGTGSAQPTTGTRTVNSLNVLDFDGSSDFMNLPSALYSVPAGNNTVFVVRALDDTTSEQASLAGSPSAAAIRYGLRLKSGGGALQVYNNTALSGAEVAFTGDTAAHITSLRRSGSSITAIYDGNQSTAGSAVNVTLTSFLIGVQIGGSGDLNGAIAEILIYSRALSDAEMNQIGAYLAAKWGIAWTAI